MSAIEQIIAWMKKRSLTSAQLAKQAEAELAALMVVVEAAKAWHGYWPDEEDLHEARDEACQCATCGLIRAVDALKGDA